MLSLSDGITEQYEKWLNIISNVIFWNLKLLFSLCVIQEIIIKMFIYYFTKP